ncbi:tRNA dihydrouridine(20/20a) synthase DusA [Panacagrimonas perspica]|nr:tRNA dihydrouridine(20/20a) synthase DusA [Panacagrimonas perspica]
MVSANAAATSSQPGHNPWRLSVAPMMDWTDRFCRNFHRQFSADARLYTEMLTTGALLHGDTGKHLRFDGVEHPVALQLGGSDPDALARCAELGEKEGYDEINLNCGCPSDRVQTGCFGAVLMKDADLVARCVRAMRRATSLPVTIKHRLGVDDSEGYDFLRQFVETVAEAGCDVFIVHARKAWLSGLSPKENREIPPLDYPQVYQLKKDYPQLTIAINGGIKTVAECERHLRHVDGVMLGREAYDNPYVLTELQAALFDGSDQDMPDRYEVLERYIPFIESELKSGTPLVRIARHILGLFRSQPGGRGFRRVLSEKAHRPGAGIDLLRLAIEEVEQDDLSEAA